nr:MAG TPA: hypothetical protein [Caudoviricetes sp.]
MTISCTIPEVQVQLISYRDMVLSLEGSISLSFSSIHAHRFQSRCSRKSFRLFQQFPWFSFLAFTRTTLNILTFSMYSQALQK